MEKKLMSLQEAVEKFVEDGDRIAIGGIGRNRCPMELVREIIRQGKRELHLIGREKGMDFDMLIGAGCVREVSFALVSLEEFGLAPNFRRAAQEGSIKVDEHACGTVINSIRASAMGIPCIPVKGLIGSDVLRHSENIVEFTCPFTKEKLVLVKALNPDVAIIHAHRADEFGNVQLFGSPWEDIYMAKAAKKVIVSVEEIIPHEEIKKNPHATAIPYFYVSAVVHAPKGAYPTSCDGYYDSDDEHIKEYAHLAKTPEGFQEYLKKYVFKG